MPAVFRELSGEAIVELGAGLIILAVFIFGITTADKNGGKIFLPADVSLLFSAPMKPQSVLMFRLTAQLGVIALSTFYLLFQIPNLMRLGISAAGIVGIFAAWFFTLVTEKLLTVWVYTATSTHSEWKKRIRTILYAVLGLILAGFLVFLTRSGLSYAAAADRFFNSPISRWIPVWGWLKGMPMFAASGEIGKALLCAALLLVFTVVMIRFIWCIHADFYEDAMARSEEIASVQAAAKEGRRARVGKKDRSEKLSRDIMVRGSGANVFFYKPILNRKRFVKGFLFSKTAVTYLMASIAVSVLMLRVFRVQSMLPVLLVISGFVFFRALGNPLSEEISAAYFVMVPEPASNKLFYSMLAGAVNGLFDLLPAIIAALVLMRTDFVLTIVCLVLIATLDFYSTITSVFIDLTTPKSAGTTVKQIVQIMFVYFGLLPDAAIIATGIVFGYTNPALLAAAAVNVLLGSIFFALSAHVLEPH